MLHVEVILNEWTAGRQRVVGRVVLEESGEIRIEAADQAAWQESVLEPFRDPESGDELTPTETPERFVRGLHWSLSGDYLFATQAHNEGECDYPLGHELPLSAFSTGIRQVQN
jgi:hypothetical protein